MQLLKDNKLLLVLILLLGITVCIWLLSTFTLVEGKTLGILILVFAFVKIRLIIIHYMEAGRVILPIRVAFESWVLIVGMGTIGLYLN